MKHLSLFFISILIFGCNSTKIPTEKLSQAEFPTPEIVSEEKGFRIDIKNPFNCPVRVLLESNHQNENTELKRLDTIELRAKSDTTISVLKALDFDQNTSFNYKWRFGRTTKKIKNIPLALPFPNGKKYQVIQGNNTNYTHNTDWSRYAVDFNLKINDTICSATNGFVVGVVDQYKFGGKGSEWKLYGNFITIYEPNSGIFTQYVHLIENGSFVEVGEEVVVGQPIGLSGMTGQTNVEHLHFNCLVPANNEDGLKSIPFQFIGGVKSTELKRGDIMENNMKQYKVSSRADFGS